VSRVLVTRHLPPGGLDPLAGHELVVREDDVPYSHEELCQAASSVEAIVCLLTDRIDRAVIESAPRLKVVANVAVGYDNIDLEAARRAGVAVCNTPGVLDETTADLAFALVLAASRRMSEAEADLRAGRWRGWGIGQYLGRDVHGATLGIVGYGRIGRAVAQALEDGRIFAAGLDVYEDEPRVSPRLLAAPRTVLLPHIGSASVATRTTMARVAAQGAAAVLAGEVPPNLVREH
jgi:lactate dehydrogenase-like 2-hydroxyacid dehydrogenase